MSYETQEEYEHFEGAMEQSVPYREEQNNTMILCKLCGNELIKEDKNKYDYPLYYMETNKKQKYDICAACAFDDEILLTTGRYADLNQPKPTAVDRASASVAGRRVDQSSSDHTSINFQS